MLDVSFMDHSREEEAVCQVLPPKTVKLATIVYLSG
jgi:hypothetical protein